MRACRTIYSRETPLMLAEFSHAPLPDLAAHFVAVRQLSEQSQPRGDAARLVSLAVAIEAIGRARFPATWIGAVTCAR